MLAEHNVRIDSDALHWLTSRLGADRAAARSEIEKLCLYAGDTGNLTLDDVRASIGDAGSVSLEDAAFAATEGNRIAADTALERALAEDTSPIAIARSFLGHLHRLRRVRAAMAAGVSRSEAVKALRPPVFLNAQQVLTGHWSYGLSQLLPKPWKKHRHWNMPANKQAAPTLCCAGGTFPL